MMDRQPKWSDIVARTSIEGVVCPLNRKAAYWKTAAREVGLSQFPASYIDYFCTFGVGTWRPEMYILPPTDLGKGPPPGDSRGPGLLTIQNFATRSWPGVVPISPGEEGYEELKAYLPFALIGNGLILCWERSTVNKTTKEMSIFTLDPDVDSLELFDTAPTLCHLIDRYTNGKFAKIVPKRLRGDWLPRAEFTVES